MGEGHRYESLVQPSVCFSRRMKLISSSKAEAILSSDIPSMMCHRSNISLHSGSSRIVKTQPASHEVRSKEATFIGKHSPSSSQTQTDEKDMA